MTDYQIARQLLPNMPEEVFRLWFDERITNNGWPPVRGVWPKVLAYIPFSTWQTFFWTEEVIDIDAIQFTQNSASMLRDLYDTNFNGVYTVHTSIIADSRNKITEIGDYYSNIGSFPSKIILVKLADSFELVDGNHRIITYWKSKGQIQINNNVKAWVASAQQNRSR